MGAARVGANERALKAAIASDQQALTNDAIKDKAFYGDPSNGFRN